MPTLRGAIVALRGRHGALRYARVTRRFFRFAPGRPDDMHTCRLVLASGGVEESHPVKDNLTSYRSALTGERITVFRERG